MSRSPVLLLGVGSNHGDDRAGCEVAARLQNEPLDGLEAEAVGTPLSLLDRDLECELLVLVDSCRGAGAPGSVHRFTWQERRLDVAWGVSSHGVGLVHALHLARSFGRLPPEIVLIGIEAGSSDRGMELSAAVARAIPGAIELIREEVSAVMRSTV
jgi:hydrogenase maturation protease